MIVARLHNTLCTRHAEVLQAGPSALNFGDACTFRNVLKAFEPLQPPNLWTKLRGTEELKVMEEETESEESGREDGEDQVEDAAAVNDAASATNREEARTFGESAYLCF